MIHATDINEVWLSLIEFGLLLQFIAICISLRETSGHWRLVHPREEGGTCEQDLKSQIPDKTKAAPVRLMRDESFDEDIRHEIKAEHLTRTAKVKFVQKFNFRRPGA